MQNKTLVILQNIAYIIWKGQNWKSQSMEIRLKFQWGYFNFICHAEL